MVKRFNFPLENVLKVRNQYKKLAERDLATAQAKLSEADHELEQTEQAYRHSFHQQAEMQDPFWREVYANYQVGLRQRRGELNDLRSKLEEKVDVEKKKLNRRMRDERVIEKLKEHQQIEYQRSVDAAEQREVEEIDLLKRGR